MDQGLIGIIYIALITGILLLVMINKKKNPGYYVNLNKKEHPMKYFYPAAAFILNLGRKVTGHRTKPSLVTKMKQLYVKENISEELFLYKVKKTAVILMTLLACCILGFIVYASNTGIEYISTLKRNAYGGGEKKYEIQVGYEGKDETVELNISEEKYSEDEIYKLFEESYDGVIGEMLSENESLEHVSEPLNLITEYGDISISWEIDDTDIIDYNGNVISDSKEGSIITLYMTFVIDEYSKIFIVPIRVFGKTRNEKESLTESIIKAIEENNSIYDSEVVLPENIDGEKIVFKAIKEHNEGIFLILALAAAVALAFGYDRTLDKQIKKRQEQMMLDFTEMVSKLSLLYEAGLSIYKAWEYIVCDYEKKNKDKTRFVYREMKMTLEKIRSGASEKESYSEFGKRCGLHPYIKLGNILEQNLTKGTKGMKTLLKQEVEEAFEERKRIAKKYGEEASTKLLIPMVMMLVVVIIIVAVPALMSLSL